MGVGILVTALPELTLPKATGLFLGLAVWRYLVMVVRSPTRLRWAIIGFIILGVGMTALGVLTTNWPSKIPFLRQMLTYLPESLLAIPEAPDSGVHANQLGGAVLFYWPFSLSVLIGWRPPRRHRIILGLLIGGIIGLAGVLLLTQSRSTWLGALGSSVAIFILWGGILPPSRKRQVMWGLVGGIILVVSIGVGIIGPDRLEQLLQEPQGMTALGSLNTIGFRFEVWQWALAAVQDFPFTGCGLGTFREVVRLLYPLNVAPSYDIAHAHNIFLQVALDMGIPGLIAYLALLGIAGKLCWDTARRSVQLRPLALGLMASLIAFHTYGLADALAPGSKPGLIFWYILGLSVAIERLSHEFNSAEIG